MKKTTAFIACLLVAASFFSSCTALTDGSSSSSLSSSPSGSSDSAQIPGQSSEHKNTEFLFSEKQQFITLFGEVIPFVENDEYYVEEYTYEDETGLNFYTIGNTQTEFEAYKQAYSSYTFLETYNDDYGDAWYCYQKNGFYVDVGYYVEEGKRYIDVYAYVLDGGNTGGGTGSNTGGTENVDLITNAGKGLPSGVNGVYEIDFTKATHVKNVTDQGYYIDGCPTVGTDSSSPAILVIPVEFSDVTAASKGYTVSVINKAFNGTDGDTDYYSVHDYYYKSSYGKLDLDITVLDTWFKPKYASTYYENATIDYYGEQTLDGCDIMDAMTGDHNAYTKFNYGWLTSSRLVVAENSVTLTIEDFSKNGDTVIIANNWDEALGAYQEYYIVVYYTNNGLNAGGNGYFSRDGIVVYHVNASLYKETTDGETYYDVYNNNTASTDSDGYGTKDNLIEFVKSTAGNFTYVAGDTISASTTDDQGNKIAYTFTVNSLSSASASVTFTKNAK